MVHWIDYLLVRWVLAKVYTVCIYSSIFQLLAISYCRSTNHHHLKIFLLTSGSLLRKMLQILWECLEPKVCHFVCIYAQFWANSWWLYYTAVGEPPICMTLSVFLAVRRAIECARSEIEDKSIVILGLWVSAAAVVLLSKSIFTDAPATPEVIQQSCNVNPKQLTLWTSLSLITRFVACGVNWLLVC